MREEDFTDEEDTESGMPLERPPAPPLLPPDLMEEWEKQKEERKKQNNPDSEAEGEPASESEYPSPKEVAAALGDPPQDQSTGAEPAAAEKSSGVHETTQRKR